MRAPSTGSGAVIRAKGVESASARNRASIRMPCRFSRSIRPDGRQLERVRVRILETGHVEHRGLGEADPEHVRVAGHGLLQVRHDHAGVEEGGRGRAAHRNHLPVRGDRGRLLQALQQLRDEPTRIRGLTVDRQGGLVPVLLDHEPAPSRGLGAHVVEALAARLVLVDVGGQRGHQQVQLLLPARLDGLGRGDGDHWAASSSRCLRASTTSSATRAAEAGFWPVTRRPSATA